MNYKKGLKKVLEETTLAAGGAFGTDTGIGTHGGAVGNSDWYAPGDARNLWGFPGKRKKNRKQKRNKSKTEAAINNLDFPIIRRTFPETFSESLLEGPDPILDCGIYTENQNYQDILFKILEKNEIEYKVEEEVVFIQGTDEYIQNFIQKLNEYIPEKNVEKNFTILIGEFIKDTIVLKDPKKSFDEYDQKELSMGIKIEMEHTDDSEIAKIIACNHLDEFPNYYTELKKMEKDLEQSK